MFSRIFRPWRTFNLDWETWRDLKAESRREGFALTKDCNFVLGSAAPVDTGFTQAQVEPAYEAMITELAMGGEATFPELIRLEVPAHRAGRLVQDFPFKGCWTGTKLPNGEFGELRIRQFAGYRYLTLVLKRRDQAYREPVLQATLPNGYIRAFTAA